MEISISIVCISMNYPMPIVNYLKRSRYLDVQYMHLIAKQSSRQMLKKGSTRNKLQQIKNKLCIFWQLCYTVCQKKVPGLNVRGTFYTSDQVYKCPKSWKLSNAKWKELEKLVKKMVWFNMIGCLVPKISLVETRRKRLTQRF